MKNVKYRSILKISILTIITFGLYSFYWVVKTKNELKRLGQDDIPSAFLIIIPFAQLYFWYKYSEGFVNYVKKGNDVIHYFVIAILPFLFAYISNSVAFNLTFFTETASTIGKIIKVQPDVSILTGIILGFATLQILFIPMLVFQMGLNKIAKK